MVSAYKKNKIEEDGPLVTCDFPFLVSIQRITNKPVRYISEKVYAHELIDSCHENEILIIDLHKIGYYKEWLARCIAQLPSKTKTILIADNDYYMDYVSLYNMGINGLIYETNSFSELAESIELIARTERKVFPEKFRIKRDYNLL